MASGEEDGPPPTKKRRIGEPKQRTTEYLDLRSEELSESEQAQLDRLLKVLHKKRKIVVIAGAGISVSAGSTFTSRLLVVPLADIPIVPDFRSSAGLFNSLKAKHNLKASGKQLFDAAVYKDGPSTSSFHDMIRSLSTMTKSAEPTAFHHLLATLAQEGRLMRLYSQNVDGIDTALPPLATQVPLPRKGPWPTTVQLHGSLDKMVCIKCGELSDFDASLFDGPTPPLCSRCEEIDDLRTTHAGKRSHGIGRLRPRMVLYHEQNPDDEAIGAVAKWDLRMRPDAVIVAGTTLKVPGVKRIVREMCNVVRDKRDGLTVWLNMDPEPTGVEFKDCWDLIIQGPCDEVAKRAAMRRWDQDPEDFKVVTEEEVQKVKKESGLPEVVVISPSKPKAFRDVQGMLTPASSPRLTPVSDTAAAVKEMSSRERKPSLKLAASKGKPLDKILGPISATKATAQKKSATSTKVTTKKSSTMKAVSKKTNPAKAAQKITLSFGVSKSTASVPPGKVKPQTSTAPTKPMVPLSPQAARNNSGPPFEPPVVAKTSMFPNLGKPKAELDVVVEQEQAVEQTIEVKAWREADDGTISPTGRVPADMVKLLN